MPSSACCLECFIEVELKRPVLCTLLAHEYCILVCFICFEKQDEKRVDDLIDEFVENVKVDVSRIGCKKVLLYPYAHLSKKLGSPKIAKRFLNDLWDRMEDEGIDTHKSPFGWYKAFDLSCIGHPLAEAYREY